MALSGFCAFPFYDRRVYRPSATGMHVSGESHHPDVNAHMDGGKDPNHNPFSPLRDQMKSSTRGSRRQRSQGNPPPAPPPPQTSQSAAPQHDPAPNQPMITVGTASAASSLPSYSAGDVTGSVPGATMTGGLAPSAPACPAGTSTALPPSSAGLVDPLSGPDAGLPTSNTAAPSSTGAGQNSTTVPGSDFGAYRWPLSWWIQIMSWWNASRTQQPAPTSAPPANRPLTEDRIHTADVDAPQVAPAGNQQVVERATHYPQAAPNGARPAFELRIYDYPEDLRFSLGDSGFRLSHTSGDRPAVAETEHRTNSAAQRRRGASQVRQPRVHQPHDQRSDDSPSPHSDAYRRLPRTLRPCDLTASGTPQAPPSAPNAGHDLITRSEGSASSDHGLITQLPTPHESLWAPPSRSHRFSSAPLAPLASNFWDDYRRMTEPAFPRSSMLVPDTDLGEDLDDFGSGKGKGKGHARR